jgi:hypothetical protein
VPIEELKVLSATINHIDPDFKAHPQIKKFYELRQKAVFEDSGIDFATAEALAFGSLYFNFIKYQDSRKATVFACLVRMSRGLPSRTVMPCFMTKRTPTSLSSCR